MKSIKHIISAICLLGGVVACSEHEVNEIGENKGFPININATYPAIDATRATIDGGFVSGDAIGLFIVDYDEDGQSGDILMQGNRASNLKLTLQDDGRWASTSQLYWASNNTPADFYGYYPFDESMASAIEYTFAVRSNQNTEASTLSAAGYISSDLLRAEAKKVQPTAETINLMYKHLMAGVTVRLEKGEGFTDSEWSNMDKTVLLRNTTLAGIVNLETGSVQVGSGTPHSIVPLEYESTWRGIVFPQTVSAGKDIVSVTVDGQSYSLPNTEGMTFLSGKMHNFTITVNRRTDTGQFEFKLSDEAITPWQNDATLHEGLVYDYLVVEVEKAGTLSAILNQLSKELDQIESLKIVGNVNQEDLDWMQNNLSGLVNLNMQKALVEGGVLRGLEGMIISHFVFPEKGIKEIVDFMKATNLTGSLIIPEGVETIDNIGLDTKLNGTISLPSTLKTLGYIGGSLRGDFRLPEGLEWIIRERGQGFGLKGNFTGDLYLPSSLHRIESIPSSLTGTINLPQGIELGDGAFENSQCTSLILPEGMTEIPGYCFRNSQIAGELVLPSTITRLAGHAFYGTKITKVIFPDALRIMDDDGPFAQCDRLMGTIELPKNVARIPKYCFQGCSGISGIVIPAGVLILDKHCFEGCNNIGSIICEGEEPPVVCDDAFLGVPKDNFTVEVPKGCVEKYKNARGWSEFKRIAEYSNFVCRPAQTQALNKAHSEDLVLNADGAWTVAKQPSWVTLSKTSGTGKTTITLTINDMAHGQANRTDTVVFSMQDGAKTYTTSCLVRQYDYEHDEDAVLQLQKATKGNNGGIDIVFAGDGFDGQSISNGSYLDLIKYQTECFFAVEPYKSMRDYFNVYVTFPLSQESGVNTMYTYVNNHFGTLQGESSILSGCTSSQLITEMDEVFDYVVTKTPVTKDNLGRTLVVLVPNCTDYEGNTQYTDNGRTLSICPPSERAYPRDTRGTIQHEAGGHGFGKLGDETIIQNKFAPENVKNEIENKHWRGWYANLATTGKLSSVPWADLIFDTRYSDYVDVYEGGYGYTRGIYRPEANSCMNYGIPYYNTPSRMSIYKRIKEYAGEDYRVEDFFAQDTFEWGATEITRGADMMPQTPYISVIPQIVSIKKISNEVRAIRNKNKNKK